LNNLFYHVYPSYYKQFSCLMGECRHSCCIGWEIDIDEHSLARYDAMEGVLGERIRNAIDRDGTPHFRLTEDERCPFLNGEGLCDLILSCGEDALCHICKCHPRFFNFAGKYVETGLGMACEGAARLILLSKEPMTLVIEEAPNRVYKPRFTSLKKRGELIALLQDRTRSIDERILACKSYLGASFGIELSEWIDSFIDLEQMDPEWTALLHRLKRTAPSIDFSALDRCMEGREYEYEQLLVYFAYRYLSRWKSEDSFSETFLVIELLYRLYRGLAAMRLSETGAFTEEDAVFLLRMLSAEIEYSDENMMTLEEMIGFQVLLRRDLFSDESVLDAEPAPPSGIDKII
jgi:lysine-N-methylase